VKRRAIIIFLFGIAILAALVVYSGIGAVERTLQSLRLSGLALITLLHVPVLALLGMAWWMIGRDIPNAARLKFFWARCVRDAAAEVLPLSQIGGFVLGVRALNLSGINMLPGALSMSVDLILEFAAKLPYALLGLLALLTLSPGTGFAGLIFIMVALIAAGTVIAALLRGWIENLLENSVLALLRRWPGLAPAPQSEVQAFLRHIFARGDRLLFGLSIHIFCWLFGAVEIWVMFALMNIRITGLEAVIIDSLVSTLRSLAFAVPAAAGTQEASYLLVCGFLGIAPAEAVAASLVRRGRELVIGVFVLAIWQLLEIVAPSPGEQQGSALTLKKRV